MNRLVDDMKNAPDGSRAQLLAKGRFAKTVNSAVPSSLADKIFGLYRGGILSAPVTAAKVAVVNPISTAAEVIKDIPGALTDRAVGLFTGKRTTALPGPRNIAAGVKGAIGAAPDALTKLKENITLPGSSSLGTEELSAGTKDAASVNYGIKANGTRSLPDKLTGGASSALLRGYTQLAGRTHGALTTVPYEGRGAMSIMQSAQADAHNLGLSGAEAAEHIKQYVADPPQTAIDEAQKASQFATSQQKTALGTIAGNIAKIPGGRYIAPITRIPGAAATQVINYSPVGILKTFAENIGKGRFDQKAFSDGIGRGVTGSAIMGTGAYLALRGRVVTNYPADKATQQLYQAANVPGNPALYVGGKAYPNEPWKNTGGTWEQIGSPGGFAAQSLLAGAATAQAAKKGGVLGGVEGGVSGTAKIVTDQPYLTGISGAMTAINTPDQAKSFYDQSAGSLVPNALKYVATATDPLQRQTSVASPLTSAKNAITNGIPGLREKNQPQVDTFGNVQKREQSPVGTLLNPFKSQASNPSSLTTALGNIRSSANLTTGKPLPIPTQINKNYPYKNAQGKPVQLTDAQRTQFIKNTGQAAQQQLNAVVNDPGFKSLTPQAQSSTVGKIMSTIRSTAKDALTLTGGKSSTPSGSTSSGSTTNSTNKIVTAAQLAIDKTNFTNSGKNYAVIGNNVYTNDKAGNVTVTPVVTYQYNLGAAKLVADKDAGDLNAWMTTAQGQLQSIVKQLSDPSTDPLTAQKLQNDASTIQTDIAKYTAAGGFTSSGSSSSSSSQPKVQNYKTSGGSTIKAPKVKAITAKGPKGAYKAPHIAKAKTPSSKLAVKSSKSSKNPGSNVAKIPKLPNSKKLNTGYYS